jgi:Zn-dependent protease
MTSPTLPERPSTEPGQPPIQKPASGPESKLRSIGIPVLLALITLCSTTAVGMRYMHNFLAGLAPYNGDADILPYDWVLLHIDNWRSGLPFSLTLIGILLAHEFGHYFACRFYGVSATLPWMLPAPSLSGTFGAVIRLRSAIRSRAALIIIGASGPICGFLVAIATIVVGISLSTYGDHAIMHVQPTILIVALHALVHPDSQLALIIPHPILTASWIGILITALNLIPAGQLDGGHIVYSISPEAHRICTRIVIGILFVCGIFFWAGWIVWGIVLLLPAMRHPRIPGSVPLTPAKFLLLPICAAIFALSLTYQPFHGYSLLDGVKLFSHHG